MSDVVQFSTVLSFDSSGAFSAPPNPSYIGPGDIIFPPTSVFAWWGLRAYSSLTTGTKCVAFRRESDNVVQDFYTLQNGTINVSELASFGAGTTLWLVTLYDQSGNGRDITATDDQSHNPRLSFSPLALQFPGPQTNNSAMHWTANAALVQPASIAAVAEFTANAAGDHSALFSDNTGTFPSGYFQNTTSDGFSLEPVPLELLVASGGPAINTWAGLQLVLNGASSIIANNGASITGTTNTDSVIAGTGEAFFLANDGVTNDVLVGYIREFGLWSGAWSLDQITKINNNQRSFWGF